MITARGVTSLVGPFLFVLALGAIAVAARGQSAPDQRTVLASSVLARSRHLEAGSAPSCPLSLPEQVKSVKAFAEMMPVFRHPRCTNCHGGVNPYVEPEIGNHRAGAMEPPDEGCQDCHDQLPGWTVPGAAMFFAGRSDEAICMQVKEFAGTGPDFVEHIRHDHDGIQFIKTGFKGDHALDNQSLADHDVVIEKPPGTQGQLTEMARNWVKAMGGEFVGSPECGCVKPRIDLKMTSKWTSTGNGSKISAGVSVTVPLKPDTSGLVFKGTAPLKHGVNSMTAPPGCRSDMKPSGGELEVTEARFDIGADQRMTISLAVAPTMSGGTWQWICPSLPYRWPIMPIISWTGLWGALHQGELIGHDYHFDEFEAASGLSLAGEPKLVGRKEVTRTGTGEGETFTEKTLFEFWWVGLKAK